MSISADLLRAVNREATVPDLLALAARHACRLLGTEFAAVFQVADGDRLVVGGSHGLSAEYVALVNNAEPLTLSVRSFRTPSTSAVLGGHAIALSDALADPDSAQWADMAKMQGYRALLAAPMHGLGGVALGSITAYSRAVRDFTPDDVRLIELLAEHTAGALEAAGRRDAQNGEVDRLRLETSRAAADVERYARLLHLHVELCDAVLASRGLAGIVEAVAEAVGGTAAMWDTGLRMAAWAGAGAGAGSVPIDGGADQLLDGLRSVAAAEHAAGGEGRAAALRESPDGTPVWVAPISVHDHLRGWLTASGPGVELLSAPDSAGLTLPVALELQATQHQAEIEARIASDLLSELLADTAESRAPMLRSRAEALGHDLRAPHFAALLSPTPTAVGRRPERIAQARDLARLAARLVHMSPRPLIGIMDGKLLALVPERGPEGCAGTSAEPAHGDDAALALLAESAAALYPDRRVHVLVKRGILGISAYRSSYLLLVRAAELLTAHSPDLVDIDSFGLYGVMLDSGPGEALSDFSRRLLAPLMNPSAASGSHLTSTLENWLASGTSVNECSKRMYLHRNTVAYRLRKIEELLGVDLSKPDDVLKIQLAMVVATVSGWRPAP
ncbi:GAF domain-containing protein [Blastococcus saxobsidens]|uniref:GAF domain-containing protein n=2 Tax=Blastococcus saxobsidens TaxID=138336 RepID=A0A4V2G287_9ACTN|nr:GAF domain-containing protein [Blastococcus saxobsidens]